MPPSIAVCASFSAEVFAYQLVVRWVRGELTAMRVLGHATLGRGVPPPRPTPRLRRPTFRDSYFHPESYPMLTGHQPDYATIRFLTNSIPPMFYSGRSRTSSPPSVKNVTC